MHQHLEFGSQSGEASSREDTFHDIENVQMRVTEIVESVEDMLYEDRHMKLKLPSLTEA